ncbi:MAG: riboflavin synthase [Candidatus Daviesbacteria bacterium]|nr:riboflavin synthase [Candidatus Daviesbacteria bacterium]
MFTGIITHLGKLNKKDGPVFIFTADLNFCKKIRSGISIAINGVCLTVSKKTPRMFSVEIMPETLNKTMLENLKTDDLVNLELPLTPAGFISGHIVQGHVDAVAKLTNITKQGISHILKFSVPRKLSKYMVRKGSVAVNGISLTIIEASKNYFTVGIIPYTWTNTMLSNLHKNDVVNIEVDILAKYVERLK